MQATLSLQGNALLLAAAVAVILLIYLIAKCKLNPFISLMAVSLGLGIVVGMPMRSIVKAFEVGAGGTLGHIALLIALGTMLGKMMAESGGTERIAHTLIAAFGERRASWAMMAVAFIVGLPVFFDVGFVLLMPIVFHIARSAGASVLLIGLSMAAGLSVVHGLVPPHPAALLAVTAYHADIGKTILYALLVGLPTAIIAGPLFARWVSRYVIIDTDNPLEKQFVEMDEARQLPSFGTALFTLLLPVLLMLIGTWANLLTTPGTRANDILEFLGNSVVALLLAVLMSFYTFGKRRGFSRETILTFTNDCLAPTATVILVVGAGGGFGRILLDSGVSHAIVAATQASHISPLLLGWLIAAMLRIATGSATVAMGTACGIVAPIAAAAGNAVHPELMVLATGAGSLVLSHVNDGGFWIVKQYFNMTVLQTLKTWTVMETLISVIGFLLTWGLSAIIV
ncbi:gluconate:H+ symporter [Dyella acidiphila]|uniref:Permease DsdX n=1 Tax=Dyella acidiphila TaxID=2775866 RepID=A0ABR9G5I2_9GAMM|nr:gluconate:H+ symporter [Dyella acidiphila]MBE1159318.1 permease DsdX [Dyella acidiphila]